MRDNENEVVEILYSDLYHKRALTDSEVEYLNSVDIGLSYEEIDQADNWCAV